MAYIGQVPSEVVTSSSQIQDGAVELQVNTYSQSLKRTWN